MRHFLAWFLFDIYKQEINKFQGKREKIYIDFDQGNVKVREMNLINRDSDMFEQVGVEFIS